jgi:SnoaL-like protein
VTVSSAARRPKHPTIYRPALLSSTMRNGTKVDMWMRSTLCLRNENGDWRLAHEHTSVPFDAETGKALVGLKP